MKIPLLLPLRFPTHPLLQPPTDHDDHPQAPMMIIIIFNVMMMITIIINRCIQRAPLCASHAGEGVMEGFPVGKLGHRHNVHYCQPCPFSSSPIRGQIHEYVRKNCQQSIYQLFSKLSVNSSIFSVLWIFQNIVITSITNIIIIISKTL